MHPRRWQPAVATELPPTGSRAPLPGPAPVKGQQPAAGRGLDLTSIRETHLGPRCPVLCDTPPADLVSCAPGRLGSGFGLGTAGCWSAPCGGIPGGGPRVVGGRGAGDPGNTHVWLLHGLWASFTACHHVGREHPGSRRPKQTRQIFQGSEVSYSPETRGNGVRRPQTHPELRERDGDLTFHLEECQRIWGPCSHNPCGCPPQGRPSHLCRLGGSPF